MSDAIPPPSFDSGPDPQQDHGPDHDDHPAPRLARHRRLWRAFFRRCRVYLPLAMVLLCSMVFFLPISGRWLATMAEREATNRLGLQVSMDRTQIVVADARAEVFGLHIGGPRSNARPFTIEHVALLGSLSGLLAGNDTWPAEVLVETPSTIRFSRDADNLWQVEGAIGLLVESIINHAKAARSHDAPDPAGDADGSPKGSPRLTIANLRVEVEAPTEDVPALTFFLTEVSLLPRPSGATPVRGEITGLVVGDRMEEFTLRGTWFPEDGRLSVRGTLSGGALPFFVPRFGQFEGSAANIALRLDAVLADDGSIRGGVVLSADEFNVKQLGVGGERWSDRNLEIRLQGEYLPAANKLGLREVAITGRNIDVGGGLEVLLSEGLPGTGYLSIQRLPAAALALGRNELLDQLGVRVSELQTTTTLRMDAWVQGPLANPAELDSEVHLRLAGWRVEAPELPEPLDLARLDLVMSRELIDLKDLDIALGGIRVRASGEVPVTPPDAPRQTGIIRLEANGQAAVAYDLLRRYGHAPDAIHSFDAPVRVEGQVAIQLQADPRHGRVKAGVVLAQSEIAVAWTPGVVGLRRFMDDVQLGHGRIRMDEGALRVEHLEMGVRDVHLVVDGDVTGGPLDAEAGDPLRWNGRVSLGGSISQVMEHLGREVEMGRMAKDLAGRFQLDVDAAGGDTLDSIVYTGRLALAEVSAVIDIPNTKLTLRDATATIDVTPERVVVRGAQLTARAGEEPSEANIVLNVDVDDQRARIETNVRTRFEFLTAVIPKELNDLLMIGDLPASGWGEIRPGFELPPGPDVIRRWAAYLARPGLRIRYRAPADLLADFRLDYHQESPIEVTPREFPVALRNIRGNAHFDPSGIHIRAAMIEAGTARNLFIREGVVILTPPGDPTIVRIQLEADYLDLNEWIDGWGEQPWALQTFSFIPNWTRSIVPRRIVEVQVDTLLRGTRFLTHPAQETRANVTFEGWSRRNPRLYVRDLKSNLYDGHGKGALEFEFPLRELPILSAWVEVESINLKPFMDDLLEREQTMDGYLYGTGEFKGQLLNYPTYEGSARYEVFRSSFARNVVPVYVQGMVDLTTRPGSFDSELSGSLSMSNQEVRLPDLELVSPVVFGTADGYVDFRGRLFFDVTASFISHQLRGLPLVGAEVSRLVDFVGRNVVSYELRGTVNQPATRTVPTIARQLAPLTSLFSDSKEKKATQTEP